MGTYLSTPVLDKSEESGGDLMCETIPAAWGVVDMQGWRKSMEDAHVAKALKDGSKVFGVFDGHGGPEVARLCQLYLVDVLTKQEKWDEHSKTGKALIEAFHALDRMIEDPNLTDELIRLKSEKPKMGEARTYNGPALHPKDTVTPDPVVDESQKTEAQESKKEDEEEVDSLVIVEKKITVEETITQVKVTHTHKHTEHTVKAEGTSGSEGTSSEAPEAEGKQAGLGAAKKNEDTREESEDRVKEKVEADTGEAAEGVTKINSEQMTTDNGGDSDADINDNIKHSDETVDTANTAHTAESSEQEEDSGDEKVGVEEAVEDREADTGLGIEDESHDAEDESEAKKPSLVMRSKDAMELFQKILSMRNNAAAGVAKVHLANDEANNDESEASSGESDQSTSTTDEETTTVQVQQQRTTLSASVPSIFLNGRQVCNLPDHPVHAGCTSVVCVVVGRTVTVANAGDSRAVLCRAGGVTEALSYDHKPMQEREMDRITKAGGFVNQFGRINGNLNLSRSIGDLKYKQVPGIHRSEQMITAEPDIVQVELHDGDEFLLLGCDGIWDCLTNEQAVKFVRDRIDGKTPTEIGVEMLDTIISEDPRATQGIGGDNMTIMIVDLLPKTRQYRKMSPVAATTAK